MPLPSSPLLQALQTQPVRAPTHVLPCCCCSASAQQPVETQLSSPLCTHGAAAGPRSQQRQRQWRGRQPRQHSSAVWRQRRQHAPRRQRRLAPQPICICICCGQRRRWQPQPAVLTCSSHEQWERRAGSRARAWRQGRRQGWRQQQRRPRRPGAACQGILPLPRRQLEQQLLQVACAGEAFRPRACILALQASPRQANRRLLQLRVPASALSTLCTVLLSYSAPALSLPVLPCRCGAAARCTMWDTLRVKQMPLLPMTKQCCASGGGGAGASKQGAAGSSDALCLSNLLALKQEHDGWWLTLCAFGSDWCGI